MGKLDGRIALVTGAASGFGRGMVEAFAEEGINLSHIDKRPLRGQQWTYTFFVDAEAHETEAPMVRALSRARKRCLDLRVLGSYARVGPGTEPGSPR